MEPIIFKSTIIFKETLILLTLKHNLSNTFNILVFPAKQQTLHHVNQQFQKTLYQQPSIQESNKRIKTTNNLELISSKSLNLHSPKGK